MLEIYNEQVRDLQVSVQGSVQQQQQGLRVRQHPKQGFYVQGLKVSVTKKQVFCDCMEKQINCNWF